MMNVAVLQGQLAHTASPDAQLASPALNALTEKWRRARSDKRICSRGSDTSPGSAESTFDEMDFRFLLMRIGNYLASVTGVTDLRADNSYYDLLAPRRASPALYVSPR